jgi:hypothetical protein
MAQPGYFNDSLFYICFPSKADAKKIHFSEYFNDGQNYTQRWEINGGTSVIQNRLHMNSSSLVSITSNISSFSNEDQILTIQFEILYEDRHGTNCGAFHLRSNKSTFLGYFYVYQYDRTSHVLGFNNQKQPIINDGSLFFTVNHNPVEHKIVIYPNNSYNIFISHHLVKNVLIDSNTSYLNTNIDAIRFVQLSGQSSSLGNIIISTVGINYTDESVYFAK